MPGRRLTAEDRERIAAGLAGGLGYAEIGRRLGRPASTIMREVSRNGGLVGYQPEAAQADTGRRARRGTRRNTPDEVGEFADRFADLLLRQGMPRVAAGVLSQLYVVDEGVLTAADLAGRLRVSAASVSTAVAFLEQQGLIMRRRSPGSRRELYAVDDEMWHRSIEETARMQDELAAAAEQGTRLLGADTPAGARFARSAGLLGVVSTRLRGAVQEWRDTLGSRPDPPRAAPVDRPPGAPSVVGPGEPSRSACS